MAWISPALTARSTLSSATTPGNVLRMPRISRIGVPVAAGGAAACCRVSLMRAGAGLQGSGRRRGAAASVHRPVVAGRRQGGRRAKGDARAGPRPLRGGRGDRTSVDLAFLVVAAVDQDRLP